MHVRISPGLHCASCVGLIEEALIQVPGVLEATANPGTDTARIRYAVGQVDFAALKRAIESTGYQAAGAGRERGRGDRRPPARVQQSDAQILVCRCGRHPGDAGGLPGTALALFAQSLREKRVRKPGLVAFRPIGDCDHPCDGLCGAAIFHRRLGWR